MSEHLPKHATPEVQEDLQEAAFAALRRLLQEAKQQLLGLAPEALVRRIDEALAGEPGSIFLGHMRGLEAENAILREDVRRFLAENARIRGLLAHFEHCPHGCPDAGFCPHYAKVRKLGLLGPRAVQSFATPGDPA